VRRIEGVDGVGPGRDAALGEHLAQLREGQHGVDLKEDVGAGRLALLGDAGADEHDLGVGTVHGRVVQDARHGDHRRGDRRQRRREVGVYLRTNDTTAGQGVAM